MNEEQLRFAAEVCRQTWEPLYRFVYYRVQNREEAEDVTQETFFKALSSPRFHEIGRTEHLAFFKAVAANLIRDRWRRDKARGTMVDIDSLPEGEIFSAGVTDAVDEQLLIREALAQLGEEQRKVVGLRILKGYSVSETARIMGIKAGHVRVLQYRALKNLADILSKEETHDEK
jgi:RNA polymerase sigma-70 factor (ECF subfamily)